MKYVSTFVFFPFLFALLHESYSRSLQRVVLLVRILVYTQDRTFATLQKMPLLSIKTYEILTQAGPKKHVKKLSFSATRSRKGEGWRGSFGMVQAIPCVRESSKFIVVPICL